MNLVSDEILKAIKYAIDKTVIMTDKTFPSIVTKVNDNGTYIILGEEGSERLVYSAIPSLNLEYMSKVWVTMPHNSLNHMYISGIRQEKPYGKKLPH